MKIKYFKKYKLNQLKKIKTTYKYIYFFRYNDLTINENLNLKKKLKKINYQSIISNQNLLKFFFPNIKGQGSILLIYGNDDVNIINEFKELKKIELIHLNIFNNIYTNLKLDKLLSKNNVPLNFLFINPLVLFINYLNEIKQANIT